MSQFTNFSHGPQIDLILKELREQAAQGRTMEQCDTLGAQLDVLSDDWSLGNRIALFDEVGAIFAVPEQQMEITKSLYANAQCV